jgi:hypothetical protein
MIELKEFLDWKGRGCPVAHKMTGNTFYLSGASRRLITDTGVSMIAVLDQPDMPNNQTMRQVMVCLVPEAELEITY